MVNASEPLNKDSSTLTGEKNVMIRLAKTQEGGLGFHH